MRVGFIGTGSMGSVLIEAFIRSGALSPKQIVASNRTFSKAQQLAERYPGLTAANRNEDAVQGSEIIFICVKPAEYKKVIEQISGVTTANQMIVSITSAVLIKHLEHRLNCKIAKVIPSITNYVFSGASLCVYSKRMQEQDIELLEHLFSRISTPIRISEQHTRICSDLSSCGPAFIAFFIRRFVDAAVEKSGMPRDVATRLASEMLLGTGKLLTDGGFDPLQLQQRVSVPGGITSEGISVMETELEGMFNQLVNATHAKYDEDLARIDFMFGDVTID